MNNTADHATETVKLMLLAQKEGRLEDMTAYYADETIWVGCRRDSSNEKLQSRADILRFVNDVISSVEFLESEITDFISDGRKVVVTGREQLRFRKSAREISNEYAIIYEVVDGLIRKVEVYDRVAQGAHLEEIYVNW